MLKHLWQESNTSLVTNKRMMLDFKQMPKMYKLVRFNLMTVNLIGLILKSQSITKMVNNCTTKLRIKRKNKLKKNNKLFLNKLKRKKPKKRNKLKLMEKVQQKRKKRKRNQRKLCKDPC